MRARLAVAALAAALTAALGAPPAHATQAAMRLDLTFLSCHGCGWTGVTWQGACLGVCDFDGNVCVLCPLTGAAAADAPAFTCPLTGFASGTVAFTGTDGPEEAGLDLVWQHTLVLATMSFDSGEIATGYGHFTPATSPCGTPGTATVVVTVAG